MRSGTIYFVFLLILGCNTPTPQQAEEKPSLIGTWTNATPIKDGSTNSLVISADGTMTTTYNSPGKDVWRLKLKWEKVSDKVFKVPTQQSLEDTSNECENFTITWLDANTLELSYKHRPEKQKFLRKP